MCVNEGFWNNKANAGNICALVSIIRGGGKLGGALHPYGGGGVYI